jgi:hypothetical protein
MTRISTAKPAALEAVLMNAVMGVGAPSYTSGVQKCSGTAEILNPKPTSTRSAAAIHNSVGIAPEAIDCATAARRVSPVNPKSRLKP